MRDWNRGTEEKQTLDIWLKIIPTFSLYRFNYFCTPGELPEGWDAQSVPSSSTVPDTWLLLYLKQTSDKGNGKLRVRREFGNTGKSTYSCQQDTGSLNRHRSRIQNLDLSWHCFAGLKRRCSSSRGACSSYLPPGSAPRPFRRQPFRMSLLTSCWDNEASH